MTEALAGLCVVDASEGVAGGYCTRLLAGLGADVIKIERPGIGDRIRRAGSFAGDRPHVETAALHLHLSAGKRSVTLDAASATGVALLDRLLAGADVFICGAPASLLAPLLESRHPSLIVTTVTPFGADGPHGDWRATEIVAMAMSGYMWMNGDPDREPIKPYGYQAEYQAGLHAALGIITALRAREVAQAPPPVRRENAAVSQAPSPLTGGQRVDVAVAEAAGFLLAGALQREMLMHRPQRRNGPRPASFAANRLYPSTIRPCADGYVHVHCHNRFHDLISILMQEPRLAAADVLAEPLGHADEIDALIDRWLARRTRAEAVAEAQELRVPMTEVFDPGEVVADGHGQLAERGFFVEVEHPVAGRVRQPGAPVRMSETPWRTDRAPTLGEHNAQVYCREVGLAPRDLARLCASGVV